MSEETPTERIHRLWLERQARIAAEDAQEPKTPEFPVEDVPDVGTSEKTESDKAVDSLIENIDILDAYRRWCGKSNPVVHGNQREGIKVSCPNPVHLDTHPSAWLNLDKQVWYCGACDLGGDVHDIAAWHFGFPVPGYRDGINFPNLRKRMAEEYGIVVKKELGGGVSFIPPSEDPEPVAETKEPPKEAAVIPIEFIEDDDFDEPTLMFPLEWKKIVPANTFLDVWMRQTSVDESPEEYHFWHGMMALGLAVGRSITMWDTYPVFGNLFICTIGRSGAGKSKAKNLLDQLLARALPYSESDFMPTGTKLIGSPASAESLIFSFRKETEDPSAPKGAAKMLEPVRGLVSYNELSSLIGRTSRIGNVLIPQLQEMYDMPLAMTTTSRTHGVDKANLPFGCCHTTTQLKSIKELLTSSHASSGFLNRWFFVTGNEKDSVSLGMAKADIEPAVEPLEQIRGWAGKPRELTWDDDARILFTKFFHDHIVPAKKRDKTDTLTRLDLLMKKVILLFSINMKAESITVRAVEQAIECFDYIVACYLIPSEQIGNTLQGQMLNDISKVTQAYQNRTNQGITMRELNTWFRKRKWPMETFARVLENMIKLDLIKVEQTKGTRGPGTTRYRYVE